MNYAIIENQVVINIALADPEYAQSQGWVEATGDVSIGWGYVDGQFVPPPPVDYSAQNKAQAQSLLQATDWTCTVDINNPQYSNPYLANQDEFLTYRSQVRQVAVNPPIDPVTFPPQPDEVWASV
jgi:hypothetical protein